MSWDSAQWSVSLPEIKFSIKKYAKVDIKIFWFGPILLCLKYFIQSCECYRTYRNVKYSTKCTTNVANNLVITCENEIFDNTTAINISLVPRKYLSFFIIHSFCYCYYELQLLYVWMFHNSRLDYSEGRKINRANDLDKCEICHYNYFFNVNPNF